MAHLLAGDEKYRDSTYGHAYRFASKPRQRTRAKTGLRRLTGYLKTMIEAIADAKMRRMERELELRGIRSIAATTTGSRDNRNRRSVGDDRGHICFPSPQRRQIPVGVSRSILGRPGQKIPAGRTLHAWTWTEMAGEALPRPRIGQRHVRLQYDREHPALHRVRVHDWCARRALSTGDFRVQGVRRPAKPSVGPRRWLPQRPA